MNKKLLVSLFLCIFVFFSCSAGKKDWENAKSENTIEAYESFLEVHPKGKYADSANAAIEELIWQSTLKDNIINGYESYLKTYPQGKYAESANNKIKELWLQAALNASKDTKEVILSQSTKVIPYGRNKLLTIFNPRVLIGNLVELSYKLENSMKEKPVLAASFTEANIVAFVTSFYYIDEPSIGYIMSEKTIKFFPRSSGLKGRTKVRIYFMTKKDLQKLPEGPEVVKAVSNIITLYLDY